MSDDRPKPQDILDKLFDYGFIEESEQDGQKGWILSTEGMFAAAILYHMLSQEARDSMPDLSFGVDG